MSDWDEVPKHYDPYRNTQTDPVVYDGQPPAPDVHDTDQSVDQCIVRSSIWNPTIDIMSVALAHDATHIYAYFKAVGKIGDTAPGGRAYLQVNLDVDNDQSTGYCVGTGGYYPSICGIDMAFEIEMYNGTFNTQHFLLHSTTDEGYNKAMADQKMGKVELATAIVGYKPYQEWVYDITEDEAKRCAEQIDNKTEGPYTLPTTGKKICFVTDKCTGPFQGSSRHAFSEDGKELEMSVEIEAFLLLTTSTPDKLKPTIPIGSSIMAHFTLEASGELAVPLEWSSDATLAFSYTFEASSADWKLVIVLVIAVVILVLVLGTLMVQRVLMARRRAQYESLGLGE